MRSDKIERLLAAIIIASTVLLVAGGIYLRLDEPATADAPDGEIPGTTYATAEGDPNTVLRPVLPTPDPERALTIEQGIVELRAIPGMRQLLDLVESMGVTELVELFVKTQIDCAQLGRSAGPECSGVDLSGGTYDAILIEDGGNHWDLEVSRAEDLLRLALAAGAGPVLATYDTLTPTGVGGTYYIAFGTSAFDASEPRLKYSPDTVGRGFGLKIRAGEEPEILSFSLLSEDWNPLKWIQFVDRQGALTHDLLFPADLDQYEEMYADFTE